MSTGPVTYWQLDKLVGELVKLSEKDFSSRLQKLSPDQRNFLKKALEIFENPKFSEISSLQEMGWRENSQEIENVFSARASVGRRFKLGLVTKQSSEAKVKELGFENVYRELKEVHQKRKEPFGNDFARLSPADQLKRLEDNKRWEEQLLENGLDSIKMAVQEKGFMRGPLILDRLKVLIDDYTQWTEAYAQLTTTVDPSVQRTIDSQRQRQGVFLDDLKKLKERWNFITIKTIDVRLEALREEPLVDIPVPSSNVGGLSCSFDVQGLQSATEKLTFADLPIIDKQFFEKTFQALEKREDVTGLKKNVLGTTALIPALLKIEGKPDEPVPQRLFQLYTVIAYLSTLSSERKKGQELSEQEDALLAFANFIVKCKIGQEDGLAGYYNMILKRGFSGRHPLAEDSSLAAVKRIAEDSIQTTLRAGFEDEKLLAKLIGSQSVSLASLQTSYLENKLFKLVGYQHTFILRFEHEHIHDALVKKSGPELAEAFFQEVPFSNAVHDFQEQVNRALQAAGKSAIGMEQIFDVLKDHLKPKNDDWDWKTPYFTFDKDGTPTGITELGAARLLIAAGLGKES